MSSAAERELRHIARGQDDEVTASLAYPVPDEPWLVIRAAGSLGAVDLILARRGRVLVTEVKDTGDTYADGTAKLNLTGNSGRGLMQRDVLVELAHEYDLSPGTFEIGFALRRKGQIHDGRPRWTWHPRERVKDATVLRARDAAPLLPHLSAPVQTPEGEHT